jgi:hypothetical protein
MLPRSALTRKPQSLFLPPTQPVMAKLAVFGSLDDRCDRFISPFTCIQTRVSIPSSPTGDHAKHSRPLKSESSGDQWPIQSLWCLSAQILFMGKAWESHPASPEPVVREGWDAAHPSIIIDQAVRLDPRGLWLCWLLFSSSSLVYLGIDSDSLEPGYA